jgi:uncharacterized membrane protein
MTSPIDVALQAQIDAYLTRLRRALVDVPPEAIAEIVREIHGHILERAEATDPLNEATLARVLDALGNPEDIGSLYHSRAMVARARASSSPWLILLTTIRWAGKSLTGLAAFFFGVFGYTMGIGWVVGAILKWFDPDRVGLWVGPQIWNLSLGSLTVAERAREHVHEVLGWWLIPIGFILGPIILILTTLILRWTLRFAFRRN